MPSASYQQTNFLGGEWSPEFQGRVDNPRYKTAMNVSSNGYPIEEGAWVKRSGFRDLMPSRAGNAARLYRFSVNPDTPYEVELSSGHLRILNGDTPVLDSTAQLLSISVGTPVQIVVDSGSAAWATGDTITFVQTGGPVGAYGGLPNQQMTLTEISAGVFTLADAATGASVNGSQINPNPSATATIGRILDFTTPWTGTDWYNVKSTMAGSNMFFFHQAHYPQMLTLGAAGFTFAQPLFDNGPFLDAVDGQTAVLSALSGTVTATFTGGFGPNQSVPTANDVGRLVRFLNEPNVWDVGTVYTYGQAVTFQGAYYVATAASVAAAQAPNSSPQFWAQNPQLAYWIWGVIAGYVGPTQVTVTLEIDEVYPNTINTWQLSKFGDPIVNGTGYGFPICGTFHEGRLWVFGANNIDSSYVNAPLVFDPTLLDGTVTDSSGISYTLEAGDDNSSNVLWARSTTAGIVLGTNGGEWVIAASALNDPITPTSIQAHRVTKYRCSYVIPVQTPLSIVFVQRFQRKIMEFLQDVFTGRYVAPNLTTTAKHLTTAGVEEAVYQEEVTPIIWVRDLAGGLKGLTYRRQSSFPTEEPLFTGWHRHTHGEPGRVFNSLQMSPSSSSTLIDYLYAVTSNANTAGTYRIQRMAKQFDEGDAMVSGFFLDGGVVPNAMVDQGTGVLIYGAYAHASLSVRVVLGGIDMGLYAVDALGRVTVPYNSTVTAAYLQGLAGQSFGEAGASLSYSVNTTPTRTLTPTTIGNFAGSGLNPSSSLASNFSIAPDFANNRLATFSGGIGSNWEVSNYNLSTRALIAQADVNTLLTITANHAAVATVAPDGKLLLQFENDQVAMLAKVDPATMTVLTTMGTTSNFPSTFQDNLVLSGGNATCVVGSVSLLVSFGSSATLHPGNVQVVRTDTMHTLPSFGVSPIGVNASSLMCRGLSAATINSVFIMEPTSTVLATLKQFTVTSDALTYGSDIGAWSSLITYAIGTTVTYQGSVWVSLANSNLNNSPQDGANWNLVNNPYATMATVGTIAPTAVDAAWTHIAIKDIGFDQSDQNLIAIAVTSDSVTHTQYMVKINSANAAILWATPIAYTNLLSGLSIGQISGFCMGWLSDSGTLSVFNTSTGAITTTVNMNPNGPQYANREQLIDSTDGNFYVFCNYDSSVTGAATPLSGTPSTFDEWSVFSPGNQLLASSSTITNYTVPAIVGFDYSGTTQGQMLRPGTPQDAGAANGPPQGKVRRNHQFAALLRNSQAVSFGTVFGSNMHAAAFTSPGGTPYTVTQLFSGTYWDTIDDDYGFDGMLAWQSTGPYPLMVVSVSGFINTQDR